MAGLEQVNLVVVGASGNVGMEFMRLVQTRRSLLRRHGLDVHVTGLMRSSGVRTSVKHRQGHALTMRDVSSTRVHKMEPGAFLTDAMNVVGGMAVLVDCSTMKDGDILYRLAMEKGYRGVVTVNKRSLTGSLARFRALHRTAREHGRRLLTGATIGAGLQTPRELLDLTMRGESFKRVEVVLGGSIAFILDEFQRSNLSFSAVVRKAHKLGLLDPPNPFVDLSGEDVSWKLLLDLRLLLPARGRFLRRGNHLRAIDAKPVIATPKKYMKMSFEEAMAEIAKSDKEMDRRRKAAQAGGRRLRYLGVVTPDGKAKASVQSVPSSHAAYALSGPMNMVSIVDCRGNRKTFTAVGGGFEVTAANAFRDFIEACGVAPEHVLG